MHTAVDKYLPYYINATKEALNQMSDDPKPKIGAGQLAAMGRMGLDELSHALKAFPDSIPITPEVGAMGEPTPQEVYAGKQEISPLESLQQDMYVPEQSQQKEMEP